MALCTRLQQAEQLDMKTQNTLDTKSVVVLLNPRCFYIKPLQNYYTSLLSTWGGIISQDKLATKSVELPQDWLTPWWRDGCMCAKVCMKRVVSKKPCLSWAGTKLCSVSWIIYMNQLNFRLRHCSHMLSCTTNNYTEDICLVGE